ncbi:cmlA [Symbiodinium necroappetens]|uniref:CmlA protein n=1 Tax=Symbiodinium necroappetens TaxID=1628268 RepID=A0A812S3E3_9DINO|nr:cmlA [Symbiodinium necroappetens]
MDYSKYTQGQGSQGGASDYKKYMESYSGDYSKYMKGQSSQGGAADYKQYMDYSKYTQGQGSQRQGGIAKAETKAGSDGPALLVAPSDNTEAAKESQLREEEKKHLREEMASEHERLHKELAEEQEKLKEELASEAKQEQEEQAHEQKEKAAPAEFAASAWSQPLLLSTGSLALGALVAVAAFVARLRRQRQVQLNGAGDYLMYAEAAIETLKKFDTLLRRGGLQNRSANQGYWESHFAYDVGPEGPLSSRLPDSEGRPLTAPGCRPIKHRPQPIKEEVEKTDESPSGSSPSKSTSIPPATPADPEQPPPEPEEGEKRASKNAPLLLSLARFMTKVKAKKSKREKLEEFFYVAEEKAKWSRRPSKPRLLTQEMEEEWAELQDKVRMEKGKWIQHSRRKVEAMFQEEEFGENWDRQQRTLQRERNPRQQENIFDTLSFVRWKVNKQLRQAMQDVEKGNKVNLPRKQDRSAGPPPPDPVWIVGDREDSGLEKARERIATLRAKKYRGKPFMPMGQGRGWRVDQDLFDHVDELFQQYGEAAAINEEAVNPRAASEMVGAKQKARRASDSDSESGHSDSESSSALQRRVVSAPATMRRVQARRITRSRAKSRELSVLPPWMRQMLVQDDIWQQLPESSPWDRTCWLQPVRVKGRTATAPWRDSTCTVHA